MYPLENVNCPGWGCIAHPAHACGQAHQAPGSCSPRACCARGCYFWAGYFGEKMGLWDTDVGKASPFGKELQERTGENDPSVGEKRIEGTWWWLWGRDLWLCHLVFGELLVRVHRSSRSVSQVPIPKLKVAVPCPPVWFMSANGQEASAGRWEAGTQDPGRGRDGTRQNLGTCCSLTTFPTPPHS